MRTGMRTGMRGARLEDKCVDCRAGFSHCERLAYLRLTNDRHGLLSTLTAGRGVGRFRGKGLAANV